DLDLSPLGGGPRTRVRTRAHPCIERPVRCAGGLPTCARRGGFGTSWGRAGAPLPIRPDIPRNPGERWRDHAQPAAIAVEVVAVARFPCRSPRESVDPVPSVETRCGSCALAGTAGCCMGAADVAHASTRADAGDVTRHRS